MLGERKISDKKIDEWLNDHKFTDVYKTGIIADFINCDPTKTGRARDPLAVKTQTFQGA
jgi:hypothetical protein